MLVLHSIKTRWRGSRGERSRATGGVETVDPGLALTGPQRLVYSANTFQRKLVLFMLEVVK